MKQIQDITIYTLAKNKDTPIYQKNATLLAFNSL